MKENQNLQKVLNHHLNGGKFLYLSYDHAKAFEFFKGTKEYQDLCQLGLIFGDNKPKVSKHDIPKEIRDNYPVWRNGKIRSIEFNPFGEIRRIKIGAKFAISFYEWDFNKLQLL